MRSFFALTALCFGLSTATPADAGAGRYGTDLHFIAETTIPSPGGGQTIAVCHLVDHMQILFVPVYTIVEGYALATDGCESNTYRDLSTEHLADLKAAGFIPQNVPDTPQVSLGALLWGHAWLIALGLGLLFRAIALLPGRGPRRTSGAKPDALAIHSLVAMSQVAIADGNIDTREIHQISSILTRLTGQGYSIERVSELLSRLNPSPSDLAQVGQDLSDGDRQIVLEAALNIAVADGEIQPSEYAVISDLAQRMRIEADAFRATLNRIAAHLQTVTPA